MSQSRAILKNTFVMGLAQIIERAATVYLGIFVARKLGARGLGVYSASMVYYGLLFLAAEIGSTTYLVREISKDRSQTSRYVVHLAVLSGMLALTFAMVARLVMPWLGYSQQLQRCLYVIIWAIIPAVLKAIQEGVFVAYQKAEFLTYSALIAAFVNVGASMYLLWHGFGVVSLVAAFVLVQFVVTAFYFLSINRRIVRLHWEFSLPFAWNVVREMRAFTGTSLMQGFLSRPEIILLSFTRNDAQIGFYSAALRIVDLWQLIPKCYMTSVYPVLSRYHHQGDKRAHILRAKSIKYLFAVSFPLTVGMFVLARPILHLLYGGGFEASVPAMRILVWGMPLGTLWAILWRVLSARGEHGEVFSSQIITLFVRFGIGYLLIHWFAALGAAMSNLLSAIVLVSLLIHQLRSDGTRLDLLPLGARLALAAACMAALTFFLQNRLNFWMLVGVGVTSYLLLAYLFKAFSEDDFSTFKNLMRVPTAKPLPSTPGIEKAG